MNTHAKHVYLLARDEWLKARDVYREQLNQIALQQVAMQHPLQTQHTQTQLDNHFDVYQKAVTRYLDALKAYALVSPEMRGRLAYDLAQNAGFAQLAGADSVARGYLEELEEVIVENARIAHEDWVKNQDKEHFAAVLLSISDAQVMGAEDSGNLPEISEEIFGLLAEGKVKRDKMPAPAVHNAPKIPPKIPPKKSPRNRMPPIGIHRTLPWGPGR